MNRAEIIDARFTERVLARDFPAPADEEWDNTPECNPAFWIDLFESQIMSRQLDLLSRRLRARDESFYTIGSAGHEGNAALAAAFRKTDMAFLHYRSGAFFIQRSKQVNGTTALYDLLLSFVASSDDPISGGRHKVLGSAKLCIPPQTSTIASHLPKAVGAALSVSRARNLGISAELPADAVMYCSFGDASLNHASALSALNSAALSSHQKIPMPIVFVCEDNGIGISVPTPHQWVAASRSHHPDMAYFSCDGTSIVSSFLTARKAADYARSYRKPVFLHCKMIRLLGHAGSDVETSYRALDQIEQAENQDPLLHSARFIASRGWLSPLEITQLYTSIRERLECIAEEAIRKPKLTSIAEVARAIIPTSYRSIRPSPSWPSEDRRKVVFAGKEKLLVQPQHLARLLNWNLADTLLRYPEALVFGEDVAQKGGVYNVTTGLHAQFGGKRVFNTPLDETSILGTAIGMAHNGFLPIPEIQFLAYLHNAEDQLRGEASTLSFFSQGQFVNPMVVRIAGLAYQKGFGGHFHNDNSLAVLRDLPGVILLCPSRPADGVLLMRRALQLAYEEHRVVVFVEPIALYMTRDLCEPGDNLWAQVYPGAEESIAFGEIGCYGESDDLVVISYGNGFYLCEQVRHDLANHSKIQIKSIDLRWLSDFSWDQLIKSIGSSRNILIVDECRRSGSLSEALVTGLVEHDLHDRRIARITAEDCFIPLGAAATLGLPSRESITAKILEMLDPHQKARRSKESP